MSKDSNRTYVHWNQSRFADLFEEFTHDHLPQDEVFVPPVHQPVNPEDEDDVIPDQHAAFGITRATHKPRAPAWKDFGLMELMKAVPEPHSGGDEAGIKKNATSAAAALGVNGASGSETRMPR